MAWSFTETETTSLILKGSARNRTILTYFLEPISAFFKRDQILYSSIGPLAVSGTILDHRGPFIEPTQWCAFSGPPPNLAIDQLKK